MLCSAFYWASHIDDLKGGIPSSLRVPAEFIAEAIRRIGDKANFYALDIAKKQDGGWMVVEINDGQMSGLGCNSADAFYSQLKRVIDETPMSKI